MAIKLPCKLLSPILKKKNRAILQSLLAVLCGVFEKKNTRIFKGLNIKIQANRTVYYFGSVLCLFHMWISQVSGLEHPVNAEVVTVEED